MRLRGVRGVQDTEEPTRIESYLVYRMLHTLKIGWCSHCIWSLSRCHGFNITPKLEPTHRPGDLVSKPVSAPGPSRTLICSAVQRMHDLNDTHRVLSIYIFVLAPAHWSGPRNLRGFGVWWWMCRGSTRHTPVCQFQLWCDSRASAMPARLKRCVYVPAIFWSGKRPHGMIYE